jgi:hypothetical protein
MLNYKRHEIILSYFMRDNFSLKSIGFKAPQIEAEILRLRECCCEDNYYRLNRVGATIPLSRKGRMLIWGLREKAIKHAAIEDEMREAGVL